MPDCWEIGIVILIFKKNGPKDLNNYRPITLLTTIYKIWAPIITNRLNPITNLITEDTQCGYKAKKSTMDIIFCLKTEIYKKRATWTNPI